MFDEREDGPYSRGTAFFLWLACAFGFCGMHRFYVGKHATGLLYLLTFGLLGVGQFIDLFRIPSLVAGENARYRELHGHRQQGLLPAAKAPEKEHAEVLLARAASQNNGRLTLSKAVIATGLPYKEAEKMLDEMLKAGHVSIDNDEETGVVVYVF
jgi:hypothetical protein